MQTNNKLNRAQILKNDEFYSRFDFVKSELDYFKDEFKNKIVYCPCDNPRWSSFIRYFAERREELKIKKLFCSYVEGGADIPLFDNAEDEETPPPGVDRVKKLSFFNDSNDLFAVADIIVTNPPFSKFTPFILKILDAKKDFLLVGGNLALTNKKIFDAFKKNRLRFGRNAHCPGQSVKFETPDGDLKNVPVFWYTSLPDKRGGGFTPTMTIDELSAAGRLRYYKDKKKVLYLERAADYPRDYNGVVAFPITSLWKVKKEDFIFYEVANCGELDSGKMSFRRVIMKRKV